MKKWLLHIMLVGMLGMLAASCSQDEEIANIPSTGTPSEKVTIRFTLDLGEQGGMSSRATWEGYDEDDAGDSNQAEPGIIDNENYIITNSLQVFMFNTDGEYIGGLKDMEAERQGNSNIYNIKGEVDVVKTAIVNDTLNCKIMVVANADAASTNTSGAVTGYNNDAIFSHTVTNIPMWGIGTYSINLIQQLQVDLDEPIYMLRSMAKIEVTLNQTIYNNGYRITGATLNNYKTQGYVVPTFIIPETDEYTQATTQTATLSGLGKTTDLLTTGVYRPTTDQLVTTGKNLSNIDNKKTYIIYVPEIPKGTDNEPNKVSLQLGRVSVTDTAGNETITDITGSVMNGTPHIILKDYNTGDHFDITRNHIYRYTITAVKTGFDLKLTVAPWTEVTENFNYEDNLSYDDGSWNNATRTNNVVSLRTSSTADATDVTAVYNFNVNTPQTIEWMAVLEDPEGKFQFDMSQTSGKGTVEGEDAIQRTVRGELLVTGSNLNLGVKAIDPSESGQYEAILRVYVTYGGKTIELDLTDGEQTELNHFTIQHSKL